MPDAHLHRAIHDVLHGHSNWYARDGLLPTGPVTICAGSFNPLHPAHVKLLKIGEEITSLPGVFELSVTNVDKPPLDFVEIETRMAQFERQALALVVTNCPRYVSKLEIFPRGSCFVMGSDTFERLVCARYYHPAESPLELFEAADTRFVVAARRNQAGSVVTAEDVIRTTPNPQKWAKLTTCVSPREFLMDVSSTAIRNGSGHS